MALRDRLTPLAERRARERIATPVIVKAQRNRLREVVSIVSQLDLSRLFVQDLFERSLVGYSPLGALPTKVMPRFGMVSAFLPREAIFSLAEERDVEAIFSDEIMWAFQNPIVPPEGVYIADKWTFTTTEWTRRLMGADVANEKGYFGRGVTVSAVDTGVSRTQEQVRRAKFETVLPGQRVDENGHGTYCASVVGGERELDQGTSRRVDKNVYCEGMAPKCGLVGIKALGYVIGCGSTSSVIEAIELSLEFGTDIISMSLGGGEKISTPEESPYSSVFKTLEELNVIPVVAAGNSGPAPRTVEMPGALPEALTVGAYNPMSGGIAEFSSRGPTMWDDIKPDCIAPGVNVNSGTVGMLDFVADYRRNRYSWLSGTSMSTPHVSGLCALMSECYRKELSEILTTSEIKTMMSKLGQEKSNSAGWGTLDWLMFERWMNTEYSIKL